MPNPKRPKTVTKALWKTMSIPQQRQWLKFYKQFQRELNELSELHNEIKAHNLAFIALDNLNKPV